MTNPTPIETLLTKLEECFLRLSEEGEEMTHEHAFMAGYVFKRGGKVIEAFREVLEALNQIQALSTPDAPIAAIDDIASEATEALARANEIVSTALANEALGETKL